MDSLLHSFASLTIAEDDNDNDISLVALMMGEFFNISMDLFIETPTLDGFPAKKILKGTSFWECSRQTGPQTDES